MNELPVFTDKDGDLIREGTLRDPLGTQAIWTSIGRRLVPNLASTAWRVEGLIAVMLIQYLCDGPLQSAEKNRFRPMFRLLEGLVEYYLFVQCPSRVCFGKRSLNASGEQFSVFPNDIRTIVNNLYQYYRGTCRRAGMLEADWTLNLVWSTAFREAIERSGKDAMTALQQALIKALESETAFIPSALIKACPGVKGMFDQVFSSVTLHDDLRTRILGNKGQVEFARMCSELLKKTVRQRFSELQSRIPESKQIEWQIREDFDDVLNSIEFLATLDTLFALIQANNGERIDKLANRISNEEDATLPRAAKHFIQLQARYDDTRFIRFFELAAIASKNRSEFLKKLVEHHKSIVKSRGHSPQVLIESDRLVVPTPLEEPVGDLNKVLREPDYGGYDYYTSVAGSIYRQLFAHDDEGSMNA